MVWTNALGVAFTATLLSVGDGGAVFVFPEDCATNTLALSMLSRESALRACRTTGFTPIPHRLAATFAQARNDLIKLDSMLAGGRIDADAAARRRTAIANAFRRVCAEKGIPERDAERILFRLIGVSTN